MTSEQFCYWLQGYMELAGDIDLSAQQVKIINGHLNSVFTKVTPSRLGESQLKYDLSTTKFC